MAEGPWSRDEVEATVADYFRMLELELSGLPYNKSERNERLRAVVHRSKGSIEFKHANISAILTSREYPYIDGYKPRGNYQMLLEQVVLEFIEAHQDFFDNLVSGPVLSPAEPPPAHFDPAQVLDSAPDRMPVPTSEWSPTRRLAKIDFVARDAANRDLGRRGEAFVLEFERRRLHDVEKRPDLAKRVEWTAEERGDGAGYDISSFAPDGSPRLIEVKTTGLGKYFPFNVTANEVRCSEANEDSFHLYRVFQFSERARLYMLPGPITRSCQLSATQYRAFVQEAADPGS